MASIFTKIVAGEIPCYKIAETEDYLAFLDIRPLHLGHTLVIPKKEIDFIFDVEDDLLAGLILFAKKVAKVLQQEITCSRIGMTVIGEEVPHAHIHLIPFDKPSDMVFANGPIDVTTEEMATLANSLAAAFQQRYS